VAIRRLTEHFAPGWTGGDAPAATTWKATTLAVLSDLNAAICDEAAGPDPDDSRTTLAFALVLPDDDRLAFAAIGDSHVFRVGDNSADDIARDAGAYTAFLGVRDEPLDALRNKFFCGTQPLDRIRAVMLATDGISERGIGMEAPSFGVLEATRSADAAAASARSLVSARRLVELALEAQRQNRSGDNVATAVIRLAD
jgi:serine/threonine protein phosphatase PrpC